MAASAGVLPITLSISASQGCREPIAVAEVEFDVEISAALQPSEAKDVASVAVTADLPGMKVKMAAALRELAAKLEEFRPEPTLAH